MQNSEHDDIKRLYRSKYDRMLAGVCAGIGHYFSIDVVLVRILWVIITFFGGVGLIMYIAAVFIIPESPKAVDEDPAADEEQPQAAKKNSEITLFFGSILILVGIGLILRQMGFFHYFQIWNIPWQMIWAIILIAVGVYILYRRNTPVPGTEASEKFDGGASKSYPDSQIFRSRSNKMLAGVCGGLAEHFNLDATLVRLVYVLISLASIGIGAAVYVVLMIVFPEKPDDVSDAGEDL